MIKRQHTSATPHSGPASGKHAPRCLPRAGACSPQCVCWPTAPAQPRAALLSFFFAIMPKGSFRTFSLSRRSTNSRTVCGCGERRALASAQHVCGMASLPSCSGHAGRRRRARVKSASCQPRASCHVHEGFQRARGAAHSAPCVVAFGWRRAPSRRHGHRTACMRGPYSVATPSQHPGACKRHAGSCLAARSAGGLLLLFMLQMRPGTFFPRGIHLLPPRTRPRMHVGKGAGGFRMVCVSSVHVCSGSSGASSAVDGPDRPR